MEFTVNGFEWSPDGTRIGFGHQPDGTINSRGDISVLEIESGEITPVVTGPGEEGGFETLFPAHGLGTAALRDTLIAFEPIVNGTI